VKVLFPYYICHFGVEELRKYLCKPFILHHKFTHREIKRERKGLTILKETSKGELTFSFRYIT